MINKYFTRFLLLIGFFFFWSSYKGYSTSTDGAEDTSELSPIELIDPAHEENLATAFNLANEYYYGKGREINKELAIQWYKKASELGLSDADEKLGIIYYNGFGVPIDYDLAFKYSLRAAEYGKPSAQNIVGICYKNGSGTKKNFKLARQWFEKAIMSGNKYARNNLISLLTQPATASGGIKPDYKYALALLEDDSDKDDADYTNIGWLNSKIIPPNLEKMIESYEKAASMGNQIAISNLAYCYLNGEGVVKHYAEALAFFYLAQAVGYNKNSKNISILERNLPPDSIQAAQNKAQAIHEKIRQNKKDTANKQETDQDKETAERESSSGSGVIITSAGLVVTAYHVIEGATKILVRTSNGDYACDVVAADKKNDIALLQLESLNNALNAAPINDSSSIKLGETVFTLGFPNIGVQGFNLKMTKGEISSTTGIQDDPRQFQISVPVQSGNSGGPLFDSIGNVVGIVVAKLNAATMVEHTGDLPQNVNYAVKSAYLIPLLEEYRSQMPSPKDKTGAEKMEKIVSDVRDACVMILAK